ncbi:MAG: ADP-ribosylglycohydrolase family protein, partial [Oscillospiraceae bacterium]
YGAWLGRCAGCLLGKPIECWTREKIKNYLIDTNQYPLSKYLSANISDELKEKYEIHTWNFQHHGFVDGLTYMPEDDDTNYTVLAFKMLWLGKPDFNANKVGEHWLYNLPILCLCTAERVAYANLCAGLLPPQTAIVNNPYRELIGAQIRGDFFGYVNPFNIKAAAKMAFEDAKLSHVKNGIYGEIFVSAMHAAAYADLSMVDLIKAGLSVVPKESRFTQKLQLVLDWYANGLTVEEVINNIHQHFDENDSHDWCHTISNAMVVAASLLYGELDFEKSIVISVTAGFDTDCNGATVGSILGLILGEKKIDSKWKAPLNDTLKTGVQGYSECKISDLAEKTCEIINRNK